jgi:hypothetical protein
MAEGPRKVGAGGDTSPHYVVRRLSASAAIASGGIGAMAAAMTYLLVKALLSGLIIAIVSEVARRSPGFGALIVSLPLVSILAILWLWRDTHDRARIAVHAEATFWYVLPSLPMFLALPAMLRAGVNFWLALALGCALTIALYALMVWIGPRFGLRL